MGYLYYATTNKAKVKSLNNELKNSNLQVEQLPIELIEPRSSDVVEIAKHKVSQAMNKGLFPVLSLDAGFYIPALDGFPKAYVNFVLETIGIKGILKLMKGVNDRTAEFREGLAYSDGHTLKVFESVEIGELVEMPRGELQPHLWSELALIYKPAGMNKTLAEMSHEEYLGWKVQQKEHTATKQFAKFLLQK